MTGELQPTGAPAGADASASQSPTAQEAQLRLGTYVNGKLQGLDACRQGVLIEKRLDGTSVVRGELETYVCEGWLAEIPDRNSIFPETREFVSGVRKELAEEIEKDRQRMTGVEADADPTGEAKREVDSLRDYYAAEAQKKRAKIAVAERDWGFPSGTGETGFGLMSDMAGMEEEDQ